MQGSSRYFQAQGLNPDGSRNPDYPVLLDLDNLIDYMLVILYTGDTDSPISEFQDNERTNQWFALRNRDAAEGFRFFVQDAEHTLNVSNSGLARDRNGPWPAGATYEYSNPQWIHQQLMAREEYRLRFGDRVHELLFNGGPLTGDATAARYLQRAGQIDQAIVAESARWGDAFAPAPLTKNDWLNAVQDDVANYFPARAAVVVDQFRHTELADGTPAPLYPLVDAPVLNQHGGEVEAGFELRLSAPAGSIYYTTDGTDPRLPDGTLNPAAVEFIGGTRCRWCSTRQPPSTPACGTAGSGRP